MRVEIRTTSVIHNDPIAQIRRSETQHRQSAARRTWNANDQPEWLDESFYREQIQPRLSAIQVSMIKSALSVSEPYALRIRGGKRLPYFSAIFLAGPLKDLVSA